MQAGQASVSGVVGLDDLGVGGRDFERGSVDDSGDDDECVDAEGRGTPQSSQT